MTTGRDNPQLHRTITAATLKADREKREKERRKIADRYEAAAEVLEVIGGHTEAVRLLREEATRWRR